MDNLLLLDTSISSLNRGDDIIMECVRKELSYLLERHFVLTLPTHVSAFHWYQVYRGLARVKRYEDCALKFVGGTNLLVKNMLTYYPQWNVNIFNYRPIRGCILVGVGAGAGEKTNYYTKNLYRKMLNREYYHSVRDERSKKFVESLGLKAINTGCPTMWCLTPEFCKAIPVQKANRVVFTLTPPKYKDTKDQMLIDTLLKCYEKVFFWIQGDRDHDYLNSFENISRIEIIAPTKQAYHELLQQEDLDYVGTRLHAGIYAIRHKKRAIIIAIDERARGINASNNLNCIEKEYIYNLEQYINSNIETNIKMPFEAIAQWKRQFT